MKTIAKEDNTNPICLYACRSTYLVFLTIIGVPLIINLIALLKDPTFWQPVLICFLAMAAFLFWIRSFRIKLSDNQILYKRLFGGTTCINVSEILKIDTEVGCFKYSDRFKPTFRIVIKPIPLIGKSPVVINAKIFCKKEINQLLEKLNNKLGEQKRTNVQPEI